VVPSQIARKFGKLEPKARINYDKYLNTSASKYARESTNLGWVIWTTFQALEMYCTGCTWWERRFWNSHFPHFWEIDQIWRGHKIGSFDPVITNSSATDSRWPQLYDCIRSNATYPFRKACSEQTSLSRPNEHVKTNERTKNIYGYNTMHAKLMKIFPLHHDCAAIARALYAVRLTRVPVNCRTLLRWIHPTFRNRGTAYNSRSFAGNLFFVGDYGSWCSSPTR
jgi:hypothetical protein